MTHWNVNLLYATQEKKAKRQIFCLDHIIENLGKTKRRDFLLDSKMTPLVVLHVALGPEELPAVYLGAGERSFVSMDSGVCLIVLLLAEPLPAN